MSDECDERVDEFYCDEQLRVLGYSGEVREYRSRLRRQRELAEEGRGPIAWHKRFMRRLGYVSPWKPWAEKR